jgi:hypothetical protein
VARRKTTTGTTSAEESAGGGTPPKRLRLPLNSLAAVRRELARCYREAKSGRLDATIATKLTYVLSMLASVMFQEKRLGRDEAFDLRLAAAEEALAQREQRERGAGTWSRARH